MHCFFRILAMVLFLSVGGSLLLACPFCRPVKTTFTEDINAADVAVLGELVARPKRPDSSEGELPAADIIDSYKTTFRIKKIYKGDKRVNLGDEIVAIYTGDAPIGAECLLRGIGKEEDLQWVPPLPLSQRAQTYVEQVLKLPENGAERLIFFEDYLEDKDPVLQGDAFDEFARADYQALKDVRASIDHERLLKWIQNPDVTPSNRRLYFTMLSVCGKPEDLDLLREMLVSGDENQLKGLDSLISCYLTLAGAKGIDLVEDEFLRGGVFWDPEYVHTYAAIMAIRFQGQEGDIIPRDRLIAALQIVLDRPELADLVIPDLARWKDWASMDRLVQMFKDAGEKSSWVRVPIVNFLRACPLPEAKEQLGELAKIDPDAVRRATTFFPFATGSRGKKSEVATATKPKEEKQETEKSSPKP